MSTARICVFLPCLAVALLAGCSSTPLPPPESKAPAPIVASPAMPAPSQTPAPPTVAPASLPAYLDPNNPISIQRSVYFGFDDFALKPQDRDMIERHGKYLQSHPSLAIRIEGNTDERGGAEYNLALGQRRAQTVANALKIYGVKESQMEAVSWGKEKPRAPGHDESAWSQNRRADLVYPGR